MQRRFHLVGCLVVVALVALALIFSEQPKRESTANTLIAAHKACEAQTGHRCD